jgi:hypothetical protein
MQKMVHFAHVVVVVLALLHSLLHVDAAEIDRLRGTTTAKDRTNEAAQAKNDEPSKPAFNEDRRAIPANENAPSFTGAVPANKDQPSFSGSVPADQDPPSSFSRAVPVADQDPPSSVDDKNQPFVPIDRNRPFIPVDKNRPSVSSGSAFYVPKDEASFLGSAPKDSSSISAASAVDIVRRPIIMKQEEPYSVARNEPPQLSKEPASVMEQSVARASSSRPSIEAEKAERPTAAAAAADDDDDDDGGFVSCPCSCNIPATFSAPQGRRNAGVLVEIGHVGTACLAQWMMEDASTTFASSGWISCAKQC